jgi:hypothetical protein
MTQTRHNLNPKVQVALDKRDFLIAQLQRAGELFVRQKGWHPSSVSFAHKFHNATLVYPHFHLIFGAPIRNVVAELEEFMQRLTEAHEVIGKEQAVASYRINEVGMMFARWDEGPLVRHIIENIIDEDIDQYARQGAPLPESSLEIERLRIGRQSPMADSDSDGAAS